MKSTPIQQRSKHPLYSIYSNMKDRCFNENNPSYSRYGGRGISVCNEWLNSFESFCKDVGERPSPLHTLDRKDNNGWYSKSNCRWATRKQQVRNTEKSPQINGVSAIDVAESIGISRRALNARLDRGIPVEVAATTPIKTYNGKKCSECATAAAAKRGMCNTCYERKRRNSLPMPPGLHRDAI